MIRARVHDFYARETDFKMSKYINISFLLILFLGVGVGVYTHTWGHSARLNEDRVHYGLATFDDFDKKITGLGAYPIPLGETESVRDAVANILRFDRGGYWRVSTDLGDVWVYIAYWGPDKQLIREVAFHTPDHCWVNSGWYRGVLEPEKALNAGIVEHLAKQRYFSAGSAMTGAYVAFWHLFDGQVIDYGDRPVPSDFSLFTSLWRVGLDQRKEQWFIRIHSTTPLSKLRSTNVLKEVLALVEKLDPDGRVLKVE